jgi:hypothetical protein
VASGSGSSGDGAQGLSSSCCWQAACPVLILGAAVALVMASTQCEE